MQSIQYAFAILNRIFMIFVCTPLTILSLSFGGVYHFSVESVTRDLYAYIDEVAHDSKDSPPGFLVLRGCSSQLPSRRTADQDADKPVVVCDPDAREQLSVDAASAAAAAGLEWLYLLIMSIVVSLCLLFKGPRWLFLLDWLRHEPGVPVRPAQR
jgi:hypothetical protein